MLRRLIPDPFLLFLVGTVIFATFVPARGAFATLVGWLSTITLIALFFFHGAKLRREEVVAGLTHWRLHLLILGFTFLFFPVLGWAGQRLFPALLPPDLWIGILFICALPSTVQSALAFVSIARGNVPAAIAAASASQMLGIVLAPVLMGLLAGAHGATGSVEGIAKVAMQIFAPFVTGHLLRPWISGFMARYKNVIAQTDRLTILIAVYGAFSAAVLEGLWQKLPPVTFAYLFAVDAVFLGIALFATWGAAHALGFNREDRITVQFCGTKKSLVQGVPMARVLFPAGQAGMILLPLMLFHQMQLMACAYIARRYAAQSEELKPVTEPPL